MAAALAAALGIGMSMPALADPYDGDWHFSLTPYVWLAGAYTSLQFETPGGSISRTRLGASPFDIVKHLHFGAMGFVDARKGKWSAFSDLIYASVGASNSVVRSITFPDGSIEIPVNLQTHVGLQELVWTAGAGYTVLYDGHSSADLFAGVRAAAADTSLRWQFAQPLFHFPQAGEASRYESLWDGIVGVRGRIGFPGSPWFVPYYADIGTGESHITAQALTGAGYGFSWGDVLLTYRWLYYDPGRAGVIDNLAMHGFAIGATFRF
jgi:hypothetical protein